MVAAASLPAQAARLVDSIEAPMAYLCLEPMPAGTADRSNGPVQQLIADPSLDALFSDPGSAAVREGKATTRALALVRGVLARSSGGLEIALTGVVPGAGRPLLILRARLQPEEADRLQTVLAGPSLAVPHRTLAKRQTYRLQDGTGRAGGGGTNEGPGGLVELALVGTDLVVGNDGSAMQEMLAADPAGTTAARASRVLAADPRFTSLRQRVTTPPGSLLVYGDWQRLGKRLQTSLAGISGFLLDSSGLGSARSVMVSVAAAQSNFAATVLLDFDGAGAGPKGGIDGWFSAAQSVPARSLLAELPAGGGDGLGGLVVAVDLTHIAGRSHRGARTLHDLGNAFERYGLDFERNVLGRLGSRGTLQFLLRRGSGSAVAEITSVYSLRAKSRKAAADLFEDLRRVTEASGLGRIVPGKDVPAKEGSAKEKRPDVLELHPSSHQQRSHEPTSVAVFEDLLLVAPGGESLGTETVVQVHEELRRAAKARGKRDQIVASTLQTIGGDNVAGLFDVDLQPMFDQVAAAFAGANQSGGARVDLSQVPKRHIGYLELQPRDGGTVMRICVLSSR
jgi:hypothetical protein